MLSKTAEYALRAVVCLGREIERPQSAENLAKLTQVPRRYLHKVLQDLVRGELVRSQPGPNGGYALTRLPETISIFDVVSAVSPLERIHRCPLGLTSHTRLCPLHAELDRVYAATEVSLRKVNLAQLLHSASSIVPLCEVSS